MTGDPPPLARTALAQKLADSIAVLPEPGTSRRLVGATALPGKATAIVGMRRSGKTTLLHQLRRERLQVTGTAANLPYINFEDERLAGLRAEHLAFVVAEHGRLVADSPRPEPTCWCFDEIQVVPGWERFVRRLLDESNHEVFVTGSSAALLSREIATTLRGRGWEVPLFPFGFAEALDHHAESVPRRLTRLTTLERTRLERCFGDWLATGGFPEVQSADAATRRRLLTDYVDVAMLRDVVERHGVTNVTALRWLIRHLLANAAGKFSIQRFHATMRSQGITVAKNTVHDLLGYLEDCFLVRTVWMESRSERQRMVNPRKVYPVDAGLIPIFDRSGRANLGHSLETAVMIELERRHCDVTWLRTSEEHEVDFVARSPEGAIELIQVSADASEPATAERELRALEEARAMFPSARRLLLTCNRDGAPRETPTGIEVLPAYEWMLGS